MITSVNSKSQKLIRNVVAIAMVVVGVHALGGCYSEERDTLKEKIRGLLEENRILKEKFSASNADINEVAKRRTALLVENGKCLNEKYRLKLIRPGLDYSGKIANMGSFRR